MKINNLCEYKDFTSVVSNTNSHWLDIRNISTIENVSEQYADICLQHNVNRKWILMINPNGQSLEVLHKTARIDASKILKLNTNKTKINLHNIEAALCNGHYSAVILCNASLTTDELNCLNKCAEQGKTACIVLTNNQQLH